MRRRYYQSCGTREWSRYAYKIGRGPCQRRLKGVPHSARYILPHSLTAVGIAPGGRRLPAFRAFSRLGGVTGPSVGEASTPQKANSARFSAGPSATEEYQRSQGRPTHGQETNSQVIAPPDGLALSRPSPGRHPSFSACTTATPLPPHTIVLITPPRRVRRLAVTPIGRPAGSLDQPRPMYAHRYICLDCWAMRATRVFPWTRKRLGGPAGPSFSRAPGHEAGQPRCHQDTALHDRSRDYRFYAPPPCPCICKTAMEGINYLLRHSFLVTIFQHSGCIENTPPQNPRAVMSAVIIGVHTPILYASLRSAYPVVARSFIVYIPKVEWDREVAFLTNELPIGLQDP